MLDLALLFRSAFQTGPILDGTVERRKIFLGSTDLEGGLALLEVAPVFLRAEEGEDDNVSGNDTDEDTLDEGVVRYDLGTGRGLDRSFMVIATDWGKNE